MQKFNQAYQNTLSHEGGYVHDPDDKGGETFKGITRVNWPNWEGWKIIDKIKKEHHYDQTNFNIALRSDNLVFEVRGFYKKYYWNKANLDQLPVEIACEIFDTGVNQGMGTAVKYFQEALNYLNNNQKDYRDIKVDGELGFKSIEAFNSYLGTKHKYYSRNDARNIKTLLKVMNGLQFSKYVQIVEKNPGQEKFFYGWLNRV